MTTSPFYSGDPLPTGVLSRIGNDIFKEFTQVEPNDDFFIFRTFPTTHTTRSGPLNPAVFKPRFSTLVDEEDPLGPENIPDAVSLYYRFEFSPDEIPSNNPSEGIEVNIEEIRFKWQAIARLDLSRTSAPGPLRRVLVFDRKEPPSDGSQQTTFLFMTRTFFPKDPDAGEGQTVSGPFPFIANLISFDRGTGWSWGSTSGGALEDDVQDGSTWNGSGGFPKYVNNLHLRHKPNDPVVLQGGAYFEKDTTQRYWSQGVDLDLDVVPVFRYFNLSGTSPIDEDNINSQPAPEWQRLPEGLIPEMLNGDIGHFGMLFKMDERFGSVANLNFPLSDGCFLFLGPAFNSIEMEVDFSVNGQATETVRAPKIPIGDLGDPEKYPVQGNLDVPPGICRFDPS